eukprot:CCRYP_014063-RB/>CCRYP_014063-RB protein AED:0.40 eAED:0.40 QI:118/0.5/0.66/1/0/0/3/0/104
MRSFTISSAGGSFDVEREPDRRRQSEDFDSISGPKWYVLSTRFLMWCEDATWYIMLRNLMSLERRHHRVIKKLEWQKDALFHDERLRDETSSDVVWSNMSIIIL